MPHVIVKFYPGRTEEQKKRLAEEITKNIIEIAVCDRTEVSVVIEDVKREEWAEKVYRPEILDKQDLLYKKPDYNPFE